MSETRACEWPSCKVGALREVYTRNYCSEHAEKVIYNRFLAMRGYFGRPATQKES